MRSTPSARGYSATSSSSFFFLMMLRPPRSTLFPTRRSSDLAPVQRGRAGAEHEQQPAQHGSRRDRKSTRLNSSHVAISYAVFCLKKQKKHVQVAYPRLQHGAVQGLQSPAARAADAVFFFSPYGAHRALHSFPTRRSSD